MNIPDFVLNWILNWIIFRPESMKKWIFKTYRPGLVKQGIDSLNKKRLPGSLCCLGKRAWGTKLWNRKVAVIENNKTFCCRNENQQQVGNTQIFLMRREPVCAVFWADVEAWRDAVVICFARSLKAEMRNPNLKKQGKQKYRIFRSSQVF